MVNEIPAASRKSRGADSVFELGQRLIEIECLRIETACHLDDGLPFEASLLRPPRLARRTIALDANVVFDKNLGGSALLGSADTFKVGGWFVGPEGSKILLTR